MSTDPASVMHLTVSRDLIFDTHPASVIRVEKQKQLEPSTDSSPVAN